MRESNAGRQRGCLSYEDGSRHGTHTYLCFSLEPSLLFQAITILAKASSFWCLKWGQGG